MSEEPAKPAFKLRPAATTAPVATAETASVAAEAAAPTEHPAAKQVQKIALGIGLGGVLVFIGIGFIAYPRLMARTRAINEARQRIKAAEAAELREVQAEQRAAMMQKPTPVAAPARPTQAAVAPTTTPNAKATLATTAAPVAAAPLSGEDAFRNWVSNAKIGGVRGGRVARILIGHSAYTLGDVVEPELGIRFDSYDGSTHTVRFRDDAGHTMDRRDW